jgi:hypothetical protein
MVVMVGLMLLWKKEAVVALWYKTTNYTDAPLVADWIIFGCLRGSTGNIDGLTSIYPIGCEN